jgi:hypothetical protein
MSRQSSTARHPFGRIVASPALAYAARKNPALRSTGVLPGFSAPLRGVDPGENAKTGYKDGGLGLRLMTLLVWFPPTARR